MKTSNEALKIVPQEDAELPKNSLLRVVGLNPGEELDPTRLMNLLGDIDGLKREIHERMRRIEAVKEAKSWLMEDALRTESLNKRLAEVGKLMHAVQSGSLAGQRDYEDPEVLRLLGRESPPPSEIRPVQNRILGEAVTIAWPKLEELPDPSLNLVGATLSGKAAGRSEQLTISEMPSVPLSLDVKGEQSILPGVGAEIEEQMELLKQGRLDIAEAKALMASAQASYEKAAEKEAKIVSDLESAGLRLAEAEQFYKETDRGNLESKQKAEQAALALAEARVREETAVSELYSARQELTTAYQFASVAAQRRLESAEFFERTARWALFAAVSSWIAMVWMGWMTLVALHKNTTIILPILGTVIFLLIGMVLVKRRVRESEDR